MSKGRMTAAAKEMAVAYPEIPAFLLECSQHNRWYSVFDRLFPYHQERCFCLECLKEMRDKQHGLDGMDGETNGYARNGDSDFRTHVRNT